MFSVLIDSRRVSPQQPSSEAVVRTLSALVPGVVEGLIRDVTLVAHASEPVLEQIADDAGCAVFFTLQSPLQAALAQAREPLVLLLVAGAVPDHGLAEEIAELMEDGLEGRAGVILRERAKGFVTRLFPTMSAPVGLMARRDVLVDLAANDASLNRIVKGLRPARTLDLRARRVL